MALTGAPGLENAASAATAPAAPSPSAASESAGVDTQSGYLNYSGTANGLRNHGFTYGERHRLAYRNGRIAERVVLYTCRDGSAFARKTVEYVDVLAPDFTLDDASNGLREGIRTESGKRAAFFRAGPGQSDKSAVLPRVPGLVADAGFDEFVRDHWADLLTGTPLSMRFLVPSRLDVMTFRVQHLRTDRVDDVPVDVFRLKLSGVLGWFLPGIDVYYGTRDHVLMRYVGLSDLRDASDDNMAVDIAFPAVGRQPGSAEDLVAAKQAPLAPCRA